MTFSYSVPKFLYSPVPQLTSENVYLALTGVTNWEGLIDDLFGGESGKKEILGDRQQYATEEEYRRTAIDCYSRGQGPRQPSWRFLIWKLDECNEVNVANGLRRYAEPLQGNAIMYVLMYCTWYDVMCYGTQWRYRCGCGW